MPGPARKARAQRGVTLIEACAVVAIVSILASAALPSFGDVLQRRRLEARASELATDLHLLRGEAVARNRSLRIAFGADATSTCYVIHTGADGECRCSSAAPAQCAPGVTAIKSIVVPTSERVRIAARVGSTVFDPARGTATPGNTVSISGGDGREIRHVVSIMGRVRTCSPNGATGYRPC